MPIHMIRHSSCVKSLQRHLNPLPAFPVLYASIHGRAAGGKIQPSMLLWHKRLTRQTQAVSRLRLSGIDWICLEWSNRTLSAEQ